jgi:hypothetical protein
MEELRSEWKGVQLEWSSFDISTMKEYDSDEFYLPLLRIPVKATES